MRTVLLIVMMSVGLAGCSQPVQPVAEVVATAIPVTEVPATATMAPSVISEPTATAVPSATPIPTETLVPTATIMPTTEVGVVTQIMVEATVVADTAFRYVFPVQDAPVSYVNYHHDYPANDIMCPIGSTFVAVTDGVVEFVAYEDEWTYQSTDPALKSGLAVGIIGDDGVRYYGSHLSAIAEGIAPGVRVRAGQPLGLTGDSGNAKGTDPHLHFGISRPTYPEDWQVRRGEMNPYLFLQAWQKGESLQPQFLP
jgi:murein DD-endopeptidase MepM/ murein hydrolase activator NlpD